MLQAGTVVTVISAFLLAPFLAAGIALILNVAGGLAGVQAPEVLTYAAAWALVLYGGWRLLARLRAAPTRQDAWASLARFAAVLWLFACAFLSLVAATFATDPGTPEAQAMANQVLLGGLVLAVLPLALLEAARALRRRRQ